MKRVLGIAVLFLALYDLSLGQPVNDNCSGAIVINLPATGVACITDSTTGATSTTWGNAVCGATTWTHDVWFTFVATGTENAIIVSPTGSPGAVNLGIAVYTGSCGNLVGTGTYCDSTAATNGSDTVIQIGAAGTQYWVEVSAFGGDGSFNLCITSSTPPSAPGTTCATAAPICTMAPFILPTAGQGGTAPFQPGCFAFASNQYYWYKFTAGTSGFLSWAAQPLLPGTELDYAVYNLTNGCVNSAASEDTIGEVGCNYHFANYTASATGMSDTSTNSNCWLYTVQAYGSQAPYLEFCPSIPVVAGQTYGIFIENYSNNQSGWSFNFNGSTFQMAGTSSFTATPSMICGTSGTVTLTNTSVEASNQTWNFGDGTASTAINPPPHTYNNPGTYIITLTVTSASGCSSISTQSVVVSPKPTLVVNNPPICTGQQDTLTAIPSVSGGTYSWAPGGATTPSLVVSLTSTTTYTVTYTSPYGCSVTATNTATLDNNHFTVSAGDDTSVCAYQDVKLYGTVTPAVGNYTYQWTPANTIVSGATTLNPVISTVGTTIYQLAATDAAGCTYTDTMTVGITGVPIPVNSTVTPSLICPGQQVQLNANVTPTGCGPTVTCSGSTQSSVVSTGTTSQAGGGTTFPTLLGNFDHSVRNEMLYQAAELTPALGGACTINEVSFNITGFNSNAYLNNMVISMTCTDSTSISTWDNSLTQVYTSADYQPIVGWNSFALSTPFAWDGVSNLIIDICWYDPATFGNQNNKAQCTVTAFNSYLSSWSNTTDLCGTAAAPNLVSTTRPNVRFDYCVPSINNYSIAWTPSTGADEVSNPAIANPTANPINTTIYTIHLGGSGGCGGQASDTVYVDTSKVSAGPNLSICPGTATELRATVTGTVIPGPATFTWTTLAGGNIGTGDSVSVSPTANTTYVLTMNGGACVKHDTVTISITGLTVTLTDSMVSCFGGSNGKILASANGTAPYTYTWNPAVGNINPDINLTANTYSVTMVDQNGCSGSATTTITQPASALSFTSNVNNVTCFGGNNGSVTVNPTGGTAPYTYTWSNGLPSNKTVTGLVSNTTPGYKVTVTDANGCTSINTVPVIQPAQITFPNTVVQNVRCLNESTGAITVSPTGGTGAFHYSWSYNANLNSPSAQNLPAGTYTVTATDANNCTADTTLTITQPANGITFSPFDTTEPTCFGGSNGTITVNVTGGTPPYNYLWSAGNQVTQTATGLAAGSYTVTVADDSLCSATSSISISQPAQIQISGSVINDSCAGNSDGSVTLTVTHAVLPASFAWSSGQTTQNISGLAPGSFSVVVTDHNGCTQTATYTITAPMALTLTPVSTNVKCFGASTGSIIAGPAGGTPPYSYAWSVAGSGDTLSNLPAGTYSVTVTDHFGCTATATEQLTQPASGPTFGAATIINDSCNGGSDGSIAVTVSGGSPNYTYAWSQNSQLTISVASDLPAGNYTVTATDANGCTVAQTNTITQPTAITFGAPVITNVSCSGGSNGSAMITPTGGTGNYSYTWNGAPGPNPDSNLVAGTYTVVVSDQYGCTFSNSVVITSPPALSFTNTVQAVQCFGGADGSITVVPGGGTAPYTFLWSNGAISATIDSLSANINPGYICTITDAAGCAVEDTTALTQPTQLGDTHSTTQVSCPGAHDGTITVDPFGGTPPYSYAVTQDGVNFIYTTNGYIQGLDSGLYTILISDNHGCTIEDTAYVAYPVPDFFTISVTPTLCFGPQYDDGSITITPLTAHNEPYKYSIDSSQYQYGNTFYGLSAGPHVIDAVNNFGCVSVLDTTVGQPAQAFVSVMPKDTTLKLGQSIQLNSSFVPFPDSVISSYEWIPSEGLSCSDCPDPVATTYAHVNLYTLVVTYDSICQASDSMTIIITNNLQVFIPNSFSPNNDGNNDVFEVYGAGIKTVLLQVFNRWGEKVFESNDQFNGWDGTYKGKIQDPGVFTYFARISFLDNTQVEKYGSITLVR